MAATNELALRFALKSHPGKVRPLNEDSLGADPNIGLFVLADGLGGYNAGEVASTMAVSSLLSGLGADLELAHSNEDGSFDPSRALHDALVRMNDEIFRAALNSTVYEGMATTVVIAWFLGGRLWVAHAGDSRLYRVRNGAMQQITKDHSFSQELLDAGMISEDEARVLPAKNLVTRAVGASPALEPEVHDYDLVAGDIILMCSDGLTEMVSNAGIGAMVGANDGDIAQAARQLVDSANDAGGRDNTSVILVRVDGNFGEMAAVQGPATQVQVVQVVAVAEPDAAPEAAPDAGADVAADAAADLVAQALVHESTHLATDAVTEEGIVAAMIAATFADDEPAPAPAETASAMLSRVP